MHASNFSFKWSEWCEVIFFFKKRTVKNQYSTVRNQKRPVKKQKRSVKKQKRSVTKQKSSVKKQMTPLVFGHLK